MGIAKKSGKKEQEPKKKHHLAGIPVPGGYVKGEKPRKAIIPKDPKLWDRIRIQAGKGCLESQKRLFDSGQLGPPPWVMEEITERLRQEIREELEQSTSESESAIDGDRAGQSGRGPRRYVDVTGLPDEVVDLLNTLDNDLDYIVQRYRNGKPCDDNERLVAQACIAIDGGRLRMVDPDAVRTEDGKAGPADQIDNENGVKGRHATNDPITEPETQIGDDDNEQSQDSEPGSGSETPQGDSPPSDTPDDGHYQGFEIC